MLQVRGAAPEDAGEITRIYNQGIEDRLATFQTEPRPVAEVAAVLRQRANRYPAVVVEDGGRVVAWAWASPYRERPWYQGIAEYSVYVERGERGRGAGRAAVAELIGRCEAAGFHKLVARVFPENEASRALCRSMGFREVGVYRRHARLDGRWRDCLIVERLIGAAAGG